MLQVARIASERGERSCREEGLAISARHIGKSIEQTRGHRDGEGAERFIAREGGAWS